MTKMAMPLPESLVAAIAGMPNSDGEWDSAFELLTVDEDGFPHVCLLSRAECKVVGEYLCLVVRSTTTNRNLVAKRKAGFVATDGAGATYVKLRVGIVVEGTDENAKAFALECVWQKRDEMPEVPMRPLEFWASARVREVEQWDASLDLLETLEYELVGEGRSG